MCTPVALELLYSARGGDDYGSLAEDLGWFPHLAVDARVELAALRTQRSVAAHSQHRGPSPTDLLIAAAAEVHGVTLLHYDRHFDLIASATGQKTEWLARRGSLG
jgi:predicted nucleic acid-binding protein